MNKKQSKDKTKLQKDPDKQFSDMLEKAIADPAKYLPKLNKIIKDDPNNLPMLSIRAMANSKNEDTIQDGIADWSSLIELDPDESFYRFNRAFCYEEVGNNDQALNDYLIGYELDGKTGYIHLVIRSLIRNRQYESAHSLYEEKKEAWEFDKIYNELADMAFYYEKNGELDRALDLLEDLRLMEVPIGAELDEYDVSDSVTTIKLLQQEQRFAREFKPFVEDPGVLEKSFWQMLHKVTPKPTFEAFMNMATVIFYKRILDIKQSLGKSSHEFMSTIPSKFHPTEILKGGGSVFSGPEMALLTLSMSPLRKTNEALKSICREKTSFSQHELDTIIDEFEFRYTKENLSIDKFGKAFSLFIQTWSERNPHHQKYVHAPGAIVDIIWTVLTMQDHKSVYAPVSGMGNLLIGKRIDSQGAELRSRRLGGNEEDSAIFELAQMNLILNGYSSNELSNRSPFIQVNDRQENYDVAICIPPFGKKVTRTPDDNLDLDLPVTDREYAYLEVMLHSLKNDGRFALVLPMGALFSGGREREFREALLKKDYVDFVMGLPDNIHHATRVKTAILFGRKRNTPRNEQTRVIGFSDMDARGYFKGAKFHDDDTLKKKGFAGHSRISLDSLRLYNFNLDPTIWDNDYTLDATAYIEDSEIGRRLGNSIVESMRGGINYSTSDIQDHGEYPFVRISELADDPTNNSLKVEAGSFLYGEVRDEITRFISGVNKKYIIKSDCLLIATKGNHLKPTIFRYTGKPIVIANGIYALFPNRNLISLEYLSSELASGLVEAQAKMFRSGAFIPNLRKHDLLKIAIDVPSFEEQKARVKRYEDLYVHDKQKTDKISKQLLGKKSEDFSKTLELMQHQLKHHIASIKSNSYLLKVFIEERHPELLEESTLPNKPSKDSDVGSFTLGDIIKRMELAGSNMTDELEVIQQIKQLENEVPVFISVPIYDLFVTVCSSYESNVAKIHIKRNKHTIAADEKMLRSMLNMIIENAIRHGSSLKRILNIWFETNPSVVYEGEKYFQIISRNDGSPLHEDFTLELFAKYRGSLGEHQNKGVGGNHITAILAKHNGFIKRFENLPSGLVEMEILIPIMEV